MRPRRSLSRAVLTAGAFSIAVAAPAAAADRLSPKKRLQVRAGQSAVVVGTAAGARSLLAADPAPRRLAHDRPRPHDGHRPLSCCAPAAAAP